MKAVSFILIWILVTLGGVLAMTATTNGEASEPSKTNFLAQWNNWINGKTYRYADWRLFSLEYRYELHDWTGRRFTRRQTVCFGEGTPNPFDLLFEMTKDVHRLRDVKAQTKDDTYTMVLPNALRLEDESGEGRDFNYQLKCELDKGRPRRFIFQSNEMPKRFSTRQVRVIYEWDVHTYRDAYGEDEFFWVPVEIIEEKIIRFRGQHSRPPDIKVSESWTLERIIAVRDVELGGLIEVPNNKIKRENSDDRQGIVNLK